MQESVILVNERDEPQGNMEKMRAHREGHLHRAFSIFIFNREGNLLLQQRAAHKYHSAGLWSNTCCSHPRPGESIDDAAARRLQEEMGLQTELVYLFRFQYHALLENGLTEHELDHVLIGFSDEAPGRSNREDTSSHVSSHRSSRCATTAAAECSRHRRQFHR